MSAQSADGNMPKAMARMSITASNAESTSCANNNTVTALPGSTDKAQLHTPKPKPIRRCTICGYKAELVCKTCKSTYYCSGPCQETDWKLHKILCGSLKDFQVPKNPGNHRAILFKWDGEQPKFVWLRDFELGEDGKTRAPQLFELLGRNKGHQINVNPVRNRGVLSKTIGIFEEREPATEEEAEEWVKRENKSLRMALSTGCTWFKAHPRCADMLVPQGGSVLVIGMEDIKNRAMRDVTLGDLRDAIDYLSTKTMMEPLSDMMNLTSSKNLEAPRDPQQELFVKGLLGYLKPDKKKDWPPRSAKLLGVRVACTENGDMSFKRVKFPRDHPFLLDTEAFPPPRDKKTFRGMDVPSAVGMPLAWIRHPVNKVLESNPEARLLRGDICDIRDCLLAELFLEYRMGAAAPRKQIDVTFIRGDFRHLQVEHMKALCSFSLEKMVPLIDGCFSQTDYTTIATKAAFNSYFEACREKYAWGKEVNGGVISPYKINGTAHDLPRIQRTTCSCKKGPLKCCHWIWSALQQIHSDASQA